MDFKDIGNLLSTLAPTVAACIGGPAAGAGIQALEGVFGLNTEGSQQDKLSAIATAVSGSTPDQLLALKKADADLQVRMAELGYKNIADLEALAVNDRNSARQREIAVKDYTPQVLAYLITAGFFGVLIFMLVGDIPMGSKDILNIMLGVLGSSWAGVISYFFGSSSGSDKKTELLAKAEALKD